MFLINKNEISFNENDRENVHDLHHDVLVLKLYVANHFVLRIFIDSGRLLNIILLNTLNKMNIPNSDIV